MKYPKIQFGDVEAVWNKLGGEEGVARFLRGELMLAPVTTIPFSGDFDPEAFIGERWKILPKETDSRGESLPGLDLSKVRFETCLKEGETYTTGEERLVRLKAGGHIRLGGKAFKACWESRHLLPESWKKDKSGNTRYIFFDGMVLVSPHGNRYTLYMSWNDGAWFLFCYHLGSDRDASRPSAVSAS
jgi:hypothetical protein